MTPSESNETDPCQERCWEEGWEGHECRQMQRMAKLSLEEKLQWLEEAQELASNLQASREAKQRVSTDAIPKEP